MKKDYINTYASGSGGIITIEGIIQKNSVDFYAFITSFSDNMTSNWNEEPVYGRVDPIGTFQSTTRKISLAFDIPAKNLDEAKSNLENINKVKRFMYPAYSSNVLPASGSAPEITTNALSLSKNPLVRIKLANLIEDVSSEKGLLGWIGAFSATPVIDMGMFNENSLLFPKVYNASIDFTPQHEFDLGWKHDGTAIDDKNFTKFPYSGGK